jgi:hypothetical protein
MLRVRSFLATRWRSVLATTRPGDLACAGGLLGATTIVFALTERLSFDTFALCVCVLGALWVAGYRALEPRSPSERAALRLSLAVLFVGALHVENFSAIEQMYARGSLRIWNVYHYYLGSKYFDELGYTGLYGQTLLADREGPRLLGHVHLVRDLTDYRIKPVDEVVPPARAPAFTDERWREFKRDLSVLLPQGTGRQWEGILTDRGYNPTPFWNTAGAALSRRLEVTDRAGLMLVGSIDLLVYLTMIAAVWWAFGAEASMLSFLCFAMLPFNPGRLIGGYIQYDWLAAIVLGVCFLKKGLAIPAAIALGYATMARVFPLLLVGGLAVPALQHLLARRRLDRFTKKLALTFIATCALGVAVGAGSAKGMGGWTEWRDKIETHNWEMSFGKGRVGLRHIFTHHPGADFEPTEEARKATYERQKAGYYVAAPLGLALFLAAVWRRSKVNSVLLAMVLVFVLLVPSHYYWSILALLPLWRVGPGDRWSPALLPALTAFVVPAGWYAYARLEPGEYARYLGFDWLLGCCLLGICGWLVSVNVRRLRRRTPLPLA